MICMCPYTPYTYPSHTLLFPLKRTYTHVPLPPTHTAWSLQWKNLTSQTNKATAEHTALKAAETIHPQPYPLWELPRTQESECSMKNVDHCMIFAQCTYSHVHVSLTLLMGTAMYVINNITISLVLSYFGVSSRPKNFDSFHQTVLSLEVHVGYRMCCMSENSYQMSNMGIKKCSMNKLKLWHFC